MIKYNMDLQMTWSYWIKLIFFFDFLDKGNEMHLIYPDFNKAPNTTPQGKLLAKIEKSGITTSTLKWIKNRLQREKVKCWGKMLVRQLP